MKILYVNFNLENARDKITLKSLRENNVDIVEIQDHTLGIGKYLNIARKVRSLQYDRDLVMVGYAGAVLVILLWFITRKPLVYNTLSTFYDSMIVSRFGGRVLSPVSFYYYLMDFLAFRMADVVFMESHAEKDLVVKIFKVDPKKISIYFVGADDNEFYFDPSVPKLDKFTVVFRGVFLPEAGANVAVRMAKELEKEGIAVRIIGRGLLQKEVEKLVDELKPNNLELITAKLSIEDLRAKMLECHISLGQLARHPRVHRTIPHKAFESMAMKLPYLSGDNAGVKEILKDGETCFTFPPGDYKALSEKILELRNNYQECEQVAERAYELYQSRFNHNILGRQMVEELASLISRQ